jgi:hypothetical protein
MRSQWVREYGELGRLTKYLYGETENQNDSGSTGNTATSPTSERTGQLSGSGLSAGTTKDTKRECCVESGGDDCEYAHRNYCQPCQHFCFYAVFPK